MTSERAVSGIISDAPEIPGAYMPDEDGNANEIYEEVLKAESSLEEVVKVLYALSLDKRLHVHSIFATRLIQLLLSRTIPNYWDLLSDPDREYLLCCLRNVPGLSILVGKLRASLDDPIALLLADILTTTVMRCTTSWVVENIKSDEELWKEYASLVYGGRVLSALAEADVKLSRRSRLGDVHEYIRWLSSGLLDAASNNVESRHLAMLIEKAKSIGYYDELVSVVFVPQRIQDMSYIIPSLASSVRRTTLEKCARNMEGTHSPCADNHIYVGGVAWYFNQLCRGRKDVEVIIEAACSMDESVQRAIATVALLHNNMTRDYLEKFIATWSDPLYIRHAPITEQESLTRMLVILLSLAEKDKVKGIFRSQLFLTGVSERLSASSNRCKELGVIVAEMMSSIVDDVTKALKFQQKISDSAYWSSLYAHVDKIGELMDLQMPVEPSSQTISAPAFEVVKQDAADKVDSPIRMSQTLASVELSDSDDPDSDDEPTIPKSKRPSRPVYIRDLIRLLQTDDSADSIEIGLQHAAPLIFRKAQYGTELTSHSQELCFALLNLHDNFDSPNFESLRGSAVAALFAVDSSTIGPLLCNQIFTNKYGLQQRSAMMSSIIQGTNHILQGSVTEEKTFPSKRLPSRLHNQYMEIESSHSSVRKISVHSDSHKSIKKSESLMHQLKASRKTMREREVSINPLAGLIAKNVFFPLLGNLWKVNSDCGWKSIDTHLLAQIIQAFAVLLSLSGPSMAYRYDVSSEAISLILAIKSSQQDPVLVESLLMLLLTVIETTKEETLIENQSSDLLDIQTWVESVYRTSRHPDVQSLVASILIKIGEIMQNFQRRFLAGTVDI